jgi:regulator of extracellular matrix RemA (YlzA/DUF370 family)
VSRINQQDRNIAQNKAFGDAYRDQVADFHRSNGRTVVTDAQDRAALTFDTPYGSRTLDMAVYDSKGNHLGYVETKTGSSPYAGTRQYDADEWLRSRGFTIDVVYGPSGCTCP